MDDCRRHEKGERDLREKVWQLETKLRTLEISKLSPEKKEVSEVSVVTTTATNIPTDTNQN